MTNKEQHRKVWQVSGGPVDRSYAEVFIKHGVALIGPGDSGPWKPERSDEEFGGSFVRRFATEVEVGDAFLLRLGIATVRAIGLVASDYLYINQFDDVNGWDLQHARRVRWGNLARDERFESRVFGANPPRISRVSNQKIIHYAERFLNSPPASWQHAAFPRLPEEEHELEEVPICLRGLVAQVDDLVGLYVDRKAFGEPPTEDEIVSHCVVPFLRALGWPVEKIAVKWRNVDVCVFRELPREPENCCFIIEAKRLGSGVEGALKQAKGYLKALGVVRDIVVTDGIRYRMYDSKRDLRPVAYANLTRLKCSALDLFKRMKRP